MGDGDIRDLDSTPGLGRSPGGGHCHPTPVFLPGESYRQRSLVGYSARGHKRVAHEGPEHSLLHLYGGGGWAAVPTTITKQFSATPAGCPTVQFSSDTDRWRASEPTGQGLGLTRLHPPPPTCPTEASHKSRLSPVLLTHRL